MSAGSMLRRRDGAVAGMVSGPGVSLPEAILGGWTGSSGTSTSSTRSATGSTVSTRARVVQAIDLLADTGPGLGRPLVDTIRGSSLPNLKELRPGTVRILFCFDPWRSSVLLVAGDKAGRWKAWYSEAIPLAEQRYETYVKERGQEEGDQR